MDARIMQDGTALVTGARLAPPATATISHDGDDNREFWMEVRRGLLLVTRAIERRYSIGGK